jgi:hypothetical protein
MKKGPGTALYILMCWLRPVIGSRGLDLPCARIPASLAD